MFATMNLRIPIKFRLNELLAALTSGTIGWWDLRTFDSHCRKATEPKEKSKWDYLSCQTIWSQLKSWRQYGEWLAWLQMLHLTTPSPSSSVLWAGFGPPNSPPYTCRRVKSLGFRWSGWDFRSFFVSYLPVVYLLSGKLTAQILTEDIKLGQVTGPHKWALTLRRQRRKRKSHLS